MLTLILILSVSRVCSPLGSPGLISDRVIICDEDAGCDSSLLLGDVVDELVDLDFEDEDIFFVFLAFCFLNYLFLFIFLDRLMFDWIERFTATF